MAHRSSCGELGFINRGSLDCAKDQTCANPSIPLSAITGELGRLHTVIVMAHGVAFHRDHQRRTLLNANISGVSGDFGDERSNPRGFPLSLDNVSHFDPQFCLYHRCGVPSQQQASFTGCSDARRLVAPCAKVRDSLLLGLHEMLPVQKELAHLVETTSRSSFNLSRHQIVACLCRSATTRM
eukprot:1950676-Amphidinium_carterae.1